MKKILYCMLFLVLSVLMVTGCSKKENTYEGVIEKIISPKTYTEINYDGDLSQYQKQCEETFKEYLTTEGLESLTENRILFMYQSFLQKENIVDIENIKISEIANEKKDEYTYVSCKVSYLYKTDNKNIEMTDYFILNLVDDGDKTIISRIGLVNEKSSIFELYNK